MKGLIHWFTENSVAANILMVIIVASGLLTLSSLRQEFFPEFSTETITVSVPYPGATPSEVEESICIKIEERIQGVPCWRSKEMQYSLKPTADQNAMARSL